MGNRVDGCSRASGCDESGKGCQRILEGVGCCGTGGSSSATGSTGGICSQRFSCRYPQEIFPPAQEVSVEGLDFDVGSPIKPRAVLDTSPLQERSSGNLGQSLFQECSADPCRRISRGTQERGGRCCENVRPSNIGDACCEDEDVKVRTNMQGPSGSLDADVTRPGSDIFGTSRSNPGNREWHGPGILTWPDGRRYVGQFNEGLFHGDAIMEWPDGRRYVGQYKNNKKHGEGEFAWPDGRRYSGQWKVGLRHGRGQYKNSKGDARIGRWVQDRPLYWEAEKEDATVLQAVPEKPAASLHTSSKASHADEGHSESEGHHPRSSSALGGA
mmetsp:Transcript_30875/g.54395  ORF Transcript_30875/g.54395 Transcript_30875/m.54395 type:complete len:328 (+) Transcript_30875:51-1034(+)